MQTRDENLLFQAEADLQNASRRIEKAKNTDGKPIILPSKVLALLVDSSSKEPIAFVAESGFVARAINLVSGKVRTTFKGHKGPVTSLALFGNFLFTGSWDKTIRKWNLIEKECVGILTGHDDFVKCLVISYRHRLLISGSSDKDIRVWDTNNDSKCVDILKGHTRGIECLIFDDDEEYLFSGSSDRSIRQWKFNSGKFEGCIQIINGHEGIIYSLFFHQSELWSGSSDLSIRTWDISNPKNAKQISSFSLQRHSASGASENTSPLVTCLFIFPPYIIVGGRDELIRAHDLVNNKQIGEPINGHYHEITGLQVIPNWEEGCLTKYKLISTSLDGTIRQWDLPFGFSNLSKPQMQPPAIASKVTLSVEEEAELKELLSDDE